MTSSPPTRPLPARVAPLPGESLISLVRRTSRAMGYESPRRLLALLANEGQLPPHLNELVPGLVLDHLAALLRQSTEVLSSLAVHCYAPALVLVPKNKHKPPICDSKTTLRYFTSSGPICPLCLEQDAIPHERLLWSFRPLSVCTKHGCLLAGRCPKCARPLRWDRQDVSRCACGGLLHDANRVSVSSYGVDFAKRYHEMLLGEFIPLSEMSPAACFWWAGQLAAAAAKTPAWLADVATRLDLKASANVDTTAWLAAVEILVDWPRRFEDFLDEFQRIDKHKTTSTGVGRRFGTLLRQAARLDDMGYAAPGEVLRRYLLERYDGGHLSSKVCLFAKPKDRATLDRQSCIPQTKAAEILGLRHGAIAPLIERGILTGRLHPAGANGRSVGLVLKQSVNALQSDLKTALDVKTAASRLGIGHHAVLELIHRGVLPRVLRTAKGWQIPRGSLAKLESVCRQLPPGEFSVPGWLSFRQATRQFGPAGLTIGGLVEFITTGEVSARMADPSRYLNGIVVSQDDLASLAPTVRNRRSQVNGYPLHQLARVLFPDRPVKSTVLNKWIARGYLKARKVGRARIVSPEEVERFRSEYCLADEACRLLGVSRSTLSRWEVEGRIRPVYGKRVTPGAGFSMYRRGDLTRLSRRRSPRRGK